MDAFALAIEGWHDFYLMIGTAAATLIGLLFVSLSINAEAISRNENADLRVLASQTFTNFISVLMFAVIFLIPGQVPLGLGLPLLGGVMYALYLTVHRYIHTRRHSQRIWGRSSLGSQFLIPATCFVVLFIIGVSVLMGKTGYLYWLVPVMILLISDASANAWNLLLRLREPAV